MTATWQLACFFPFVVQGILMLVDEFVYHRARGLGRWETVGHPLDTLTVAVALAFLVLTEPSSGHLLLYAGLAAFSCFFVTKDEFVHQEKCPAAEHWLHAMLFTIHPVVFFAAGFFWWHGHVTPLAGQTALVAAFGLFQIFYWRKRGFESVRQ